MYKRPHPNERGKMLHCRPGDNYNGPRHSNDKRYNSFYTREVTLEME
jgi:hypothetical protein